MRVRKKEKKGWGKERRNNVLGKLSALYKVKSYLL